MNQLVVLPVMCVVLTCTLMLQTFRVLDAQALAEDQTRTIRQLVVANQTLRDADKKLQTADDLVQTEVQRVERLCNHATTYQ